MARSRMVFVLLSLVLLFPLVSSAAVPQTINYQGYLTNSSGQPVNTPVSLTFSLYSAATGGTALWTENHSSVTVANGVYSVILGSVDQQGNPLNLPFDQQYWLGVAVGADPEMSSRLALTAVPYAFRAVVADTVSAGGITSSNIAPGSVTIDKLADVCAGGEVLKKTASGWACGAPPCIPNDFLNCYSGPATTLNVGPCRPGIRRCSPEGILGNCEGEILPAIETCDFVDNDCDGIVDNAPDAQTWFRDLDGDGFGTPDTSMVSCPQPVGYVANSRDCNDNLTSVFKTSGMAPMILFAGGIEICGDGVDNDCDGQTDEQDCSAAACNAGEIAAFNACMGQLNGNIFNMNICIMSAPISPLCRVFVQNTVSCLLSSACIEPPAGLRYDCASQQCRPQWEAAFGAFPPACLDGESRGCGSNVGACHTGTQSCANGQWSACEGSVGPTPEICGDNIDNDCDGIVDNPSEWFADSDGDGFGSDFASPILSCEQPQGYVAQRGDCDDNNPNVNQNAVEICDGIDNNCNGIVDEGVPGEGEMCSTGLPGICAQGFMMCQGGMFMCMQMQFPEPEVCNGIDDDCDGVVDNSNPGGGSSCGTGLPGICSSGTMACQNGLLSCSQNQQPQPEVCNGLDDDCDGVVDNNDPGGGITCGTGLLGICAAGTTACQAGTLSCVQNLQLSAEVCDGLDNNCNGIVDEGNPGGGGACSTGLLGVCMGGTTMCQSGALACVQNVQPSAEICDGKDNNCNGQIDEGNPGGGAGCFTGQPGICAAGTTVCQSGAVICLRNLSPTPEVCDGLDNNCNGQIDEGNPGGGMPCGTGLLGVCAAGTTACQGGAISCVQNQLPSIEICGDGMDNDCNGIIDDGCP